MNKSLKKLFSGLFKDLIPSNAPLSNENRKPVTIWLPIEYHAKFEKAQQLSEKKFSGVIRKLIIMALDFLSEDDISGARMKKLAKDPSALASKSSSF